MMDLEQYRLILESSPNMIWRSNLTTQCDYFNKTWLDFTGRTMEQEYGFGWAEGVHPDDLERCVKIYTDHFKAKESFEMDYRLKRHDGQYRWINDRGIPFYNDKKEFIGFIGSCMDVTEKVEGQVLKEMAQNDALCQTYTRQYARQLLSDEFKKAQKNRLPLSLLAMDIDDFKTINDNYGHPAGDLVLKEVASAIKKEIENVDILGRYGGDEFLIGLPKTNHENALKIAERINTSIAQAPIRVSDVTQVSVTVSIGAASLEHEQTIDELIARADQRMYDAKKQGKNLVKG